jgi:hypothetical protein
MEKVLHNSLYISRYKTKTKMKIILRKEEPSPPCSSLTVILLNFNPKLFGSSEFNSQEPPKNPLILLKVAIMK